MRKILILNKIVKEIGGGDYYSYDLQYSIPATSDWIEVSDDEFYLLIKYQSRLGFIVLEKSTRSLGEIMAACEEAQILDAKKEEKRIEALERKKRKKLIKEELSKQEEKERELLLFEELKKKYGS